MKSLSTEDKRKLTVGVIVAGVVLWMAVGALRGQSLLSHGDLAGPTYSTPVGNATLGQLAVSLLISLGTLAITVGGELLKRVVGLFMPKSGPDAGTLADVAADRMQARDRDGYLMAFDLHGCCQDKPSELPPPAEPTKP